MSGKTNQCKEHLLPASCSRIATLAAGESRAGETAAHAIGLRERGGCGAVGVCTIGLQTGEGGGMRCGYMLIWACRFPAQTKKNDSVASGMGT